jgi:hypothetical protein
VFLKLNKSFPISSSRIKMQKLGLILLALTYLILILSYLFSHYEQVRVPIAIRLTCQLICSQCSQDANNLLFFTWLIFGLILKSNFRHIKFYVVFLSLSIIINELIFFASFRIYFVLLRKKIFHLNFLHHA